MYNHITDEYDIHNVCLNVDLILGGVGSNNPWTIVSCQLFSMLLTYENIFVMAHELIIIHMGVMGCST
jgi:hypothetical protein